MDDLERERVALAVFAELCELPANERAPRLAARCGGDPALQSRVELLLEADKNPVAAVHEEQLVGDFLDTAIRGISGGEPSDMPGGPPAPTRVPNHYRILRVLGEGGMATVYEAEQVHPRRNVAIKVIRGGLFSPELRQRFEYEAQVLAGLQHPGIARLYEAETRPEHLGGTPGARGYLAMELVRGEPIDAYAAAHALGVSEKVNLLLRVCDAVEYAHRMGVLHRDLKPANILVDPEGQPKVLDFGVARAVDRDGRLTSGITHAGGLVGTLPYMSPEQVDARFGVADTRCDVYALGVVAYQLFAGVLPIEVGHGDLAAAVARICTEEPVRLGARDRRLRGDLDVIVAKALRKQPDQRYPSVRALAEDLRSFLAGRAIAARADSAVYVLRKAAWRYRRTAAVVVAFLSLVTCFGVYANVQAARSARLARDATKARLEAVAAGKTLAASARDLRRALYTSSIGFAQSALGNNDVTRARAQLESCPPDLRGWEWLYLRNQCDQSLAVRELGPHTPDAVDISRDHARLAVGTDDGIAYVLDARTGATLFERRFPEGGPVAVAISADGTTVACGPRLDELCVSEVATGKVIWRAEPGPPPKFTSMRRLRALRFSPDGRLLAAAGYDGHLRLRDAATGRVLRGIDARCLSILCLAFTHDGGAVVGGDNGGTVRLWRVDDGALLHESRAHLEAVGAVAVSPDGRSLATGASDGEVSVRTLDGWSESARMRIGHTNVWSVAFSGDGGSVAVGSDDNLVRLWRPGETLPFAVLRGHGARVIGVTFEPDGRYLASLGADATARRWRLDRSAVTPAVTPGNAMTHDCAFTPDGAGAVAACNDGTVRLWDVKALNERWRYAGPLLAVHAVAVEARHARVAVGDAEGVVTLLRLDDGQPLGALAEATDNSAALAVSFSPDGTVLAAAHRSGTARLWDVAGRRVLATVAAHDGPATSLDLTSDGRRLVTAGADGRVRLWSVPGGNPLATSEGRSPPVREVRFSPDGTCLAVALDDGTVRLLDASSLRVLRDFRGHVGSAVGLAFHPSGSRLASSGADRTIRIWDPVVGDELVTLRGHGRVVHRIAFSRDGSLLASTSADRTLRLWSAGPPTPADAPSGR